MEFLSAFTVEIVKFAISPLLRPIGYFVHYKRNVENLVRKVIDLQNTRRDVQIRVITARRNLESIRGVVEAWLEKVDMELIQNEKIMGLVHGESVEFINYRCCKGCWSCTRYNVGREAHKKIVIINELLSEGNSFNEVSDPSSPPGIESVPTNADFEAFASREATKKKVMEALKDETTYLIGLYGMGGVGKTTLMNQVGKQMKEENLFDAVVMTTVSHNLDLKRIQGEIAKKLGLHRLQEEDDILTRAAMLSKRLKQEKSILVILDDLWTTNLDLFDVGIPFGENHHKGCKVVITSRRSDVCSMITQKNIEVGVLSEEESWDLFKKNSGEVVDSSPSLQKTAKEVAKECEGLPIALVTLGRALKYKDEIVWNDTLLQLRSSDFTLIEGMDSKVSSLIELSYNYLGNKVIQKCFLYCCLFPEDHKITMDELMMYVMSDELLLEKEMALKQLRGRLHTVVNKLIVSSLLFGEMEEDSNEYCVWMHDIVRDVAISIASSEEGTAGFFVKAGMGLKHWPQRHRLLGNGKCLHMSLMRNEINVLPDDQPELSQLLTLSLEGNKFLKEIPDCFLERMLSLATLDLRRTGISSLPLSLSCLENLRALYFDSSLLRSVHITGALKKLEILSLQNCGLERLPEEIGGLSNLRLLNLSDNPNLRTIPPNLISSLSRLEELYMWDSFRAWEIEGEGNGSNASLIEVSSMINDLTVLQLYVDCLDLWLRLSIGRGGNKKRTDKLDCSGFFECTIFASPPLSHSIKVLMRRVCSLMLRYYPGLITIRKDLAVEFNNCLKHLRVESCNEMESLMSVAEEGFPVFSKLEEIQLHSLGSLVRIFHGPLPIGFLQNLKILQVVECHNLHCIFSSSMFENFQNLEVLHVHDCNHLQSVFQVEEGSSTLATLIFPNLREIRISKCTDLEHIFPSRPLFHCCLLREMYFYDLSNLTTIWKGAITFGSLQNIKEIIIERCRRIKHIFPSVGVVRGVGGLSQLQQLKISYCESMEEIFYVQNNKDEVLYDETVLPQLQFIYLWELPNLKTIARGVIPFGSLTKLTIFKCARIKYVFPMKLLLRGGLTKLEELEIRCCDNIKVIINGDGIKKQRSKKQEDIKRQVLPKLKQLYLLGLPKLSTFYQQDQLPALPLDWPSLEKLSVFDCKNVKSLPFTNQSAIKLRELRVDDKWFDGLEFEDPSVKSRLQSLFKAE